MKALFFRNEVLMRCIRSILVLVFLPCASFTESRGQLDCQKSSRGSIVPLIRNLRNGDPSERVRTLKLLYEWGEDAAPATEVLVETLSDRDHRVREAAMDTLTAIGPKAFPSLFSRLKGHDIDKKLLALEICSRIGSGRRLKKVERKNISPILIDCLNDKKATVRFESVNCLREIRDVSSVPQLIKVLENDKDMSVRQAAIMACIAFSNEAEAAVPVLGKMLVEDFDKQYGYGNGGSIGTDAALALSSIGEASISTLASIVMNVRLKREIRRTALDAMRNMTGRAKYNAAPAICQSLSDKDEMIRYDAAFALGEIGLNTKRISTALIKALSDQSPHVRLGATAALGKMESADQPVRVALLTAAADKDPYVRIEAVTAINRFDRATPIVLSTILPALEDRKANIRRKACLALQRIGGTKAIAAIPKLIDLMKDSESSVRLQAIHTLSTIAAEKGCIDAAIPSLKLATTDSNSSIRFAANECLKRTKR